MRLAVRGEVMGGTAANGRVVRNPNVVYRVLKDHGPVLFDTDSGHYFALNETGRVIWLAVQSGDATVADLVAAVSDAFEDVPPETADDVVEFIDALVSRGLVVIE